MARKKLWLRISLASVCVIILVALAGLMYFSYGQAINLISHPLDARRDFWQMPEDFGLPYENISVITEDGLTLQGWYIAPQNGAVVMLQHGYKANRSEMLEEAEMLHRHGFGALITSTRSHDVNPSERIHFGRKEMMDLRSWHGFLMTRSDVVPGKIGVLGNSLGGALMIQFASQTPDISAVMAHSAFSSLHETVNQSIQAFANLPPFPFATLVMFWAERELGFPLSEVDAKLWISEIAPRPVLILQGGSDDAISVESGERLFASAQEPKTFWFEPEGKHCNFDLVFPEKFEERMINFFTDALLTEVRYR